MIFNIHSNEMTNFARFHNCNASNVVERCKEDAETPAQIVSEFNAEEETVAQPQIAPADNSHPEDEQADIAMT